MKVDLDARPASPLDIAADPWHGTAAVGASTPPPPCQVAERQALQRVLDSRCFARTTRLSAFLKYVCIATLEGRGATLTEHHIGQHVFSRPAIYNPAEDTIVRTTARLLRLRLDEYYATEGSRDPLRITVPRGGYTPLFGAASQPPPYPPAVPEAEREIDRDPAATALSPPVSNHSRRNVFARLSERLVPKHHRVLQRGAMLATGLAIGLCIVAWRHGPPSSPSDALWSALMDGDRDTLFVPADSNLVLYQLNALRELSLDDYVAKRFGPDSSAPELKSFRNRQTSVSSVSIAMELGKRAGRAADRLRMRYARDLQWSDLRQANLILFGVRQSNPWVEPFRNRFNFHIDWDVATEKFLVRNDRPAPGERAQYEFSKSDPAKRGYAYVAYTRGLTGQGHVLLIQGTTAAGAEAAEDFALDGRRLDAAIRSATADDRVLGDFEVLLECVMQAGGSSDVRVIATRVHPLA